jgi:phage-related baseplate assembly protein
MATLLLERVVADGTDFDVRLSDGRFHTFHAERGVKPDDKWLDACETALLAAEEAERKRPAPDSLAAKNTTTLKAEIDARIVEIASRNEKAVLTDIGAKITTLTKAVGVVVEEVEW